MRQLLLLRHAKSSPAEGDQPDRSRPLSPAGRKAMERMRAVVEDLGLLPDLVLVSTALRTQETLDLLEPWAETPLVEPMDALYLAPVPTLLAALRDVAETVRSVMLVGHNPGLHDLATLLCGGAATAPGSDNVRRLEEGYPPGTLAEFTVAGPWRALGPDGGRLVRLVKPQELPGARA